MSEPERFSFADVEKELRKKIFGIINTVDTKGRPHSTGIIFGLSAPGDPVAFYVVTQRTAAKVRYIKKNPNVSFIVTFPHHYLRFIPDSTVMVRGKADLLSLDDECFRRAFEQKKMLKMNLQMDPETMAQAVVIRIIPDRTVFCYGIGIGLNEMRKDPTQARYKVTIPEERLSPPSTNTDNGMMESVSSGGRI